MTRIPTVSAGLMASLAAPAAAHELGAPHMHPHPDPNVLLLLLALLVAAVAAAAYRGRGGS